MSFLRILSINLLVDRADLSDLRRVITEADPDVVCTHEMGHMTAAVVAELLPNSHLGARDDLFGMGIATKYPATVERLDLECRSRWAAIRLSAAATISPSFGAARLRASLSELVERQIRPRGAGTHAP